MFNGPALYDEVYVQVGTHTHTHKHTLTHLPELPVPGSPAALPVSWSRDYDVTALQGRNHETTCWTNLHAQTHKRTNIQQDGGHSKQDKPFIYIHTGNRLRKCGLCIKGKYSIHIELSGRKNNGIIYKDNLRWGEWRKGRDEGRKDWHKRVESGLICVRWRELETK